MAMETFGNKWGLAVVILLIATGTVWLFGASGFRIGEGFLLVRTGSVELQYVLPEAVVFLNDEERRGKKNLDGSFSIKNIEPGTYTIMVAKEDHWPWIKKINLSEQQVLVLHPFTISKSPKVTKVSEDDELYLTFISSIKLELLPTMQSKKTSIDGLTAIWLEDNAVMIEWLGDLEDLPSIFCSTSNTCDQQIIVYSGTDTVSSIDFYLNQTDVLLIASGNKLIVVDVDSKNVQNIQPLYEGTEPVFKVMEGETLYILDAGELYVMTL